MMSSVRFNCLGITDKLPLSIRKNAQKTVQREIDPGQGRYWEATGEDGQDTFRLLTWRVADAARCR